jgi:ribonuclease HI
VVKSQVLANFVAD